MSALPQEATAGALGVRGSTVDVARRRRVARAARQQLATAPVVDTRPTAVRLMSRLSTRGFVLLIALLFTITLGGVLALNTLLTQGSFARYELLTKDAELVIREQALSAQIATLERPQNLATKAYELGMVPNTSPVFIDPATGALRGTPVPAPEMTESPLAGATAPTAKRDGAPAEVVPGAPGETPLGLRPAEAAQ